MDDRTGRVRVARVHWALALLLVTGFFSAYGYASSHHASNATAGVRAASAGGRGGVALGSATRIAPTAAVVRSPAGSTAAADCCGASGPVAIAATATLNDGVQRIAIDVSHGRYDPSEVHVRPGIPVELSFGAGAGCLGTVAFDDLQVTRDLHAGAVVGLPALPPGAHEWHCGNGVVYGQLVVR